MDAEQIVSEIEHAGRVYAGLSVFDLLEAGVPQAAIDAALLGARAQAAKVECRRRIYAVASAETQLNMASAATAVSLKTASARTDREKALAEVFVAALDWVAAMRAAVDGVVGDASRAIDDDAAWPECPDAVRTLAASF